VSVRNGRPHVSLNVEALPPRSPTLTGCKSRGIDDLFRRELLPSSRKGHAEEARQDVVSVFLVGGQKPVLQEEILIRPAYLLEGLVRCPEHLVGRNANNDFRVLCRDQFESLLPAIVSQVASVRPWLPKEILAHLLFKARGDGHDWRHPMWLLFFCLVRSHKPVPKIPLVIIVLTSRCRPHRHDQKSQHKSGYLATH